MAFFGPSRELRELVAAANSANLSARRSLPLFHLVLPWGRRLNLTS